MKLLASSGALFLLVTLALPTIAFARAPKEQPRYSINDWFAQKKKMRAMDLWLGFHKPSPYEFYFGGSYQSGTDQGNYYQSWNGFFSSYVYMIGAHFQREWTASTAQHSGLLHLRLIGVSQKSTNLVLEGGLRHEDRNGVSLLNPIGGATLTLYLNSFMGIDGSWHHFFPADVAALGGNVRANRYQAGVFLEFKWLRVFGRYFYESEQTDSTSQATKNGLSGGLRIGF